MSKKIKTTDNDNPNADIDLQREQYAGNNPIPWDTRHNRSVVKAPNRGPGRPRKRRKRGGAISMGRYPFIALLNAFLVRRRAIWSDSTYKERERKYRYLSKVFRNLMDQGKIDTMNPKKFKEDEIYAFEGWMRDIDLDPSTRRKYRGLIKDFLNWNDNFVYDKLIKKRYISTQEPPKEIRTIENNDFQQILSCAEKNRTKWIEQVRYFMIAMYGYLGLRNKELRLSDIEDLDLKHWTFIVKHPKGEGRYGKKRTIPIVNPLKPIIQEHLSIREQYLKDKGFINTKPLIPSIVKNNGKCEVSYYSGNKFRVLARELVKQTGVEFKIKTLRATCGQLLKDMGANIETVSKFLGHSSTRTTERFYCRLRDEAMFREVNSLFNSEKRSTISPLIENKKDLSGYA